MKKTLSFLILLSAITVHAQLPDHIYQPNIHSVKLYKSGDVYSYPVMALNSGDQLELHFDDLDADVKNYYYTYQLCNSDWTSCNLQPFDYIKGFISNRITTYRYSSISLTRYTHYEATIPERNCIPSRSGNYMLKVFLNNDTSQLYFTRRLLITDNRVAIAAQMMEPYNVELSRSDQRIRVIVNTVNAKINTLSPQDLKVVVLQNNIWLSGVMVNRPGIYRGDYYEYNDDATSFPAGREWRWIDLRSMQLMSDRMQKIVDSVKQIHVFVKPDGERKGQVYVYYRDLDGMYTVENSDGNNPDWQSDYGYVHFTFVPPGNRAYAGKDLYLFGELTHYSPDDASRMVFNPDKGIYEGTLFLKQGYYNYSYISIDSKEKNLSRFSFGSTEGNYNSTENNYTILVYYRSFGGRSDELIGYTQVNTVLNR
jgi:Domain of unknown function (DUF5103)